MSLCDEALVETSFFNGVLTMLCLADWMLLMTYSKLFLHVVTFSPTFIIPIHCKQDYKIRICQAQRVNKSWLGLGEVPYSIYGQASGMCERSMQRGWIWWVSRGWVYKLYCTTYTLAMYVVLYTPHLQTGNGWYVWIVSTVTYLSQ